MAKDEFKEIKETLKEVGKKLNDVAEQQKKTAEQQKKTEREIDKVAREIGGGLGRAAEGLTAPCVPEIFGTLGFEVRQVQQRVKSLDLITRKVRAEVDLLCPAKQNGKEVVLVGEVKAHLTSEDIKYFIEDNISSFKENYPNYSKVDVIGFVSGLNIDEAAKKFAFRQGLYILAPKGETMELLNTSDFKPKMW